MGFLGNLMALFGGKANNVPQAASPAAQNQIAEGQAGKVLVVEDDVMLASAMEMKLKHEGFSVAVAQNGQLGIDTAQTFMPNIVITDIIMPVMDGKTMLS